MKKLFYLIVSLVVVTGLCVCTSCKKTEKVEKKQEVTKTEEVQKNKVTTPAVEKAAEEAKKKVEEVVPEKKTAPVTAADIAAGEEVYKGKGMCIMCHGADGSKPFKLTKLFTGGKYTVEEEKEWINKEPQMKMLKDKLTEQDLINVNAYINQKLRK